MNVYLSGPISGQGYDGAVGWYDTARRLIHPSVKLIRPMRGKTAADMEPGTRLALSIPKAIHARDRWDTTRVDLVLMNLVRATRISIGCMIEAGWADQAGVPVILCMEEEGLHDHAILESIAGFKAYTLEEGCDILNKIVMDDVYDRD